MMGLELCNILALPGFGCLEFGGVTGGIRAQGLDSLGSLREVGSGCRIEIGCPELHVFSAFSKVFGNAAKGA